MLRRERRCKNGHCQVKKFATLHKSAYNYIHAYINVCNIDLPLPSVLVRKKNFHSSEGKQLVSKWYETKGVEMMNRCLGALPVLGESTNTRGTHIMPISPPIMLCSSAPSLSYYSFPVATYYA